MKPELGRDMTVAIVLIAAIVALVADSVVLGAAVLGAAAALIGLAVLIRSRVESPRGAGPRSH